MTPDHINKIVVASIEAAGRFLAGRNSCNSDQMIPIIDKVATAAFERTLRLEAEINQQAISKRDEMIAKIAQEHITQIDIPPPVYARPHWHGENNKGF